MATAAAEDKPAGEMPTPEWPYMDTLRPPVYVCLRRKPSSDGKFHRMLIDGRLDKDEWSHVPWSEPFVDIEGVARKPTTYPRTRFKMMHDATHVYIGAELLETQIWGTLRTQNSTMYHENDFEVFLNLDGSRHCYYELELNCLNTIWELLLHKPYKDGYAITNPYNLQTLRTAVFVDGVTNDPLAQNTKWCVEVEIALSELAQFDTHRLRQEHPSQQRQLSTSHKQQEQPDKRFFVRPGDVWRVNFSRVQYALEPVVDSATGELRYEKAPLDQKEANIVWAPTGVIDIHRPEKWGLVFFSEHDNEEAGERDVAQALATTLGEQLVIERVLDTIYYDQRAFYEQHEGFVAHFEQLYTSADRFRHADLLTQWKLGTPAIACDSELVTRDASVRAAESSGEDTPRHQRRAYVPSLDLDDENDDTALCLLSPRSREIRRKEVTGLFATYTATVRSATQEWNIAHDARLWRSA